MFALRGWLIFSKMGEESAYVSPSASGFLHRLGICGFIFATISAANDGRFEINQLCVDSGCFAGDDPGFPVQIANPGSYVLTSNLVAPDDTIGVVISANNVGLDLGGFAVRGPFDCSGINPDCSGSGSDPGITSTSSPNNLLISNGSVSGFAPDCIALASPGIHLRDLTISDCTVNGINALGDGLIESVLVYDNGGSGAFLSQGHLVRDSVFRNNGSNGVTFGICRGNLFASNGDASSVAEEACQVDDETNICNLTSC